MLCLILNVLIRLRGIFKRGVNYNYIYTYQKFNVCCILLSMYLTVRITKREANFET